MELHGLLDICWGVLNGPGKLAVGNYEEGWSQIDGEEQAMATNGGSRIEWSGRRFGRQKRRSLWIAKRSSVS